MVGCDAIVEFCAGAGVDGEFGGAAAGAVTEKSNWLDERLPLSTSTDQVAAVVVKVGLITKRVLVWELIDRLGNTSPVRLSRSVTVEDDVKPLPLMVKD